MTGYTIKIYFKRLPDIKMFRSQFKDLILNSKVIDKQTFIKDNPGKESIYYKLSPYAFGYHYLLKVRFKTGGFQTIKDTLGEKLIRPFDRDYHVDYERRI